MKVQFRGRTVLHLEVDDVMTNDYPDFCDAYFSYAEYEDGTPLTEEELIALGDEHGDVLNEMCMDSCYSAADDARDRMMDR